MKTKMIMTAFMLNTFLLNAQNNNKQTEEINKKIESISGIENIKTDSPLYGLHKAEPNEISHDDTLMLDGITTPVFSEDTILLNENEFMERIMSNNYAPIPYLDNDKNVQAFLLSRLPEKEKEKIKEMRLNQPSGGELIDKKATSFSVTDINGKKYSLDELKNKVIVMNFWFVECKPCVMEIPELNKLVEKYKNKDVVFLGFSITDETKLKDFLKKNNFSYHIIPNSAEISESYNVKAYPTHIILDKHSTIKYKAAGLSPTTIVELDNMIENLLK